MFTSIAQRIAIRTDGEFAHRGDTIEGVARFYDCSQTRALLAAAEDVSRVTRGIERVLQRDDLTAQQRREIAETLSTQTLNFTVDVEVTATPDL